MVSAKSYDQQYGITGQDWPKPSTSRYLIVFTSDEERTEIPMDLTPAEARLLVSLAKKVNDKATWSADVRMSLTVPAPQAKD